MKRLVAHVLLSLALSLCAATLPAQTVYKTHGANGPVFSDKPLPGAKAIELKPLNVIESAPVSASPAASASPAPSAQAAPYRSFAIVFPENDGSVLANTAIFEVRVVAEPALLLGEGHAFTVSINGKPVGQRFTATEFTIPAEFWGDELPPPNQRIQLDAAIVDRSGAVLKQAAPIQFYLRHATLNSPTRKPRATNPG
jgi:hypothetical protein